MSSEPQGIGGSAPQRMSRPDFFISVARLLGERSSCPRANVGAIAVKDGRILASGYVGAPSGLAHCDEVGCLMEAGHCIRSVHAEANLIAWAARTGTQLYGSVMWCTHSPCKKCAQLIANAGIERLSFEIVYQEFPHYNPGLNLLDSMNITHQQVGLSTDHAPRG